MAGPAVMAEHVGKRYTIGHEVRSSNYMALRDILAQSFSNTWRKTYDLLRGRPIIEGSRLEEVWALQDVCFEVQKGEAVGIIGRNGAGKSTLLKILSRITEPTTGRITIRGRVGSLLEVGTGFHPELTGRENIYLNGTILGMQRKEIAHHFDEIVAFAEVEQYLDTPVKRYSSGMYVRLAFAVAAHLNPEILIIDEVLAVGDLAFQKKCLGKMEDVAQKDGRTVLFVSHNMGAISQLCSRSIWIDRGQIQSIGPTAETISQYLQSMNYQMAEPVTEYAEDLSKDMQLREVTLFNSEHLTTTRFSCDEPVMIEMLLDVRKAISGLYGYLEIARADGTVLLVSDSHDTVPNPIDQLAIGSHNITVKVPARTLAAGDYTVYLNFSSLSASQFDVESPGIVSRFSLDDLTSRRGNNRHGYLSTLLTWETVKLPMSR